MRRIIPMLLLAVAACAHARKEIPPVVEAPAAAPAPVVEPVSVAVPTCQTDRDCAESQLCLSSRCVAIDASTAACDAIATHFDYDQATVRQDDLASLQRAARCLKARPAATLRIEGNCDDRGTTQYNMVLGSKRAAAAEKYLLDLGVERNRASTITYGKEKPRCTEETETCWSENRRDDLMELQEVRGNPGKER